jgi:uroporphyrinogen-III synthase
VAVVLVTRAAPEAEATAARLRELGHEAIVSPVLEIESTPLTIDAHGVQALLFTSAAAPRALAGQEALKSLRVIAVGDATARAAREAGFLHVASADGAGADLIALARSSLLPRAGLIVHLAGEDVAVDVAEALQDAGFDARRVSIYRAAPARALTDQAVSALRAAPPRIESVLFHSARGADSFARLLVEAGIGGAVSKLSALCLSQRVADAAKALAWRDIIVASAPREAALLSLLQRSAGERT